MANVQLIAPNTNAVDYPGMCLRFTQRGFQNRNTIFYRSAWNAWENARHPRYTATPLPDDVVVPIYFAHWGRYDDGLGWYQGRPPGSLGNWGHIALRFPNGAILSSPRWGDTETQEWFSSVTELERAFNATYVGWSYDLAGVMVADVAPTPPRKDIMTPAQEAKLDRALALLERLPRKTADTLLDTKVARHPAASKLGTTTLRRYLAKGETLLRRNITRFDQAAKKK